MNGEVNSIGSAFYDAWAKFVSFIPEIIAAIIIVIIGWIIGVILGKVAAGLAHLAKIDRFFSRTSYSEKMKMGYFSVANLIGGFVKWFVIILSLVAAADALHVPQLSEFLNRLLAYIPNVFVAGLILILGFIAADYAEKFMESASGIMANLKAETRRIMGMIMKYGIISFSVLAALDQLKIVPELIRIFFAGIMLALALAFGLGGRDAANKWLDKMNQ